MPLPPHNLNKNGKKRGFNLIETAMVMGIVGLIIGGSWIAISTLQQNMKTAETLKGLIQICDRATIAFPRNLAPAAQNDSMVTPSIKANIFPPDWINNSTVNPPIGGSLSMSWLQRDFTGSWLGGDIGGDIKIYLDNVPQHYCLAIMSRIPTNNESFIRAVEVKSTPFHIFFPSTVKLIYGCGSSDIVPRIGLYCRAR